MAFSETGRRDGVSKDEQQQGGREGERERVRSRAWTHGIPISKSVAGIECESAHATVALTLEPSLPMSGATGPAKVGGSCSCLASALRRTCPFSGQDIERLPWSISEQEGLVHASVRWR